MLIIAQKQPMQAVSQKFVAIAAGCTIAISVANNLAKSMASGLNIDAELKANTTQSNIWWWHNLN